jgi:integrase
MENLSSRVTDWLNARCESDKSRSSYIYGWRNFESFCLLRGKDPNKLVDEFRALKYEGEVKKEVFLDDWQDLLRAFTGWLKPRMASLSHKQCLSAIKSFMRFWKIPLDVDLPRHPFVTYHNRDIKKEEVKLILNNATPRDRVIYLVLAESGMRSDTAVNLKYWQLKEDFEAKRVPMKILLPSSSLKDHVGDRWTFIGEDGFRELSDYLKRRLPLKDEDYIFLSEKQGLVKGGQFSAASLSVKFNRIVQKLGIDKSLGQAGKPKRIRLHGLRKYFRNNHGADSSFVNFWMGHSLGVDAHYISRDSEEHRKRYTEGYKALRIFEPNPESLIEIIQQVKQKDRQINEQAKQLNEMKGQIEALSNIFKLLNKLPAIRQMMTEEATEPVKKELEEHFEKLNPEEQERVKKDAETLKQLSRSSKTGN